MGSINLDGKNILEDIVFDAVAITVSIINKISEENKVARLALALPVLVPSLGVSTVYNLYERIKPCVGKTNSNVIEVTREMSSTERKESYP